MQRRAGLGNGGGQALLGCTQDARLCVVVALPGQLACCAISQPHIQAGHCMGLLLCWHLDSSKCSSSRTRQHLRSYIVYVFHSALTHRPRTIYNAVSKAQKHHKQGPICLQPVSDPMSNQQCVDSPHKRECQLAEKCSPVQLMECSCAAGLSSQPGGRPVKLDLAGQRPCCSGA